MWKQWTALGLGLALSACNLVPAGLGGKESSAKSRTTSVSTPITMSAGGRQCLAQLDKTGSRFSALPDKYFGAGCSTVNAVTLAQLRGDTARFEISNLGPVTCPTASAFASWARFGVDRAARQILGSELVRIETMGSYNCRNVAGSNRRSAHSRAEAIDVAGFVLADGRRIILTEDWDNGTPAERKFLRTVHRSACKRFGTVLGPEYNSAHRDHFHLEKGNGSFCR